MSKNTLGKVYVVGASSFLGSSFYNFLKKKKISVTGTYYSKKISNLEYFDLSKFHQSSLVKRIKSGDIVFLFSSLSNVNWVYKNKKISYKFNVFLTINFFKVLIKKNIKIVFISTAEVFDGYKGNYHEKSLPNPLCYYGVTKYKVEKFLKNSNYKNYLIVRTGQNISYDIKQNCMISKIYKTLQEADAKMAFDSKFNLTYVGDLCVSLFRLVFNKHKSKQKIFHISSQEIISRTTLADTIIKFSKFKNKNYKKINFRNIKYLEPRARFNNLLNKYTINIYKHNFKKVKDVIKKKVMILDGNEKYN
jgi:dTDP-4-dehydrorhamnose reductase